MWNGEKEQVVTIIMAAEGTVARNMFFILRRTYHQKLVNTSTYAYLSVVLAKVHWEGGGKLPPDGQDLIIRRCTHAQHTVKSVRRKDFDIVERCVKYTKGNKGHEAS